MAELLDLGQLRERLEGNRRLTLRVAGAFAEADLFQYRPVETMRPFADMVKEIIGIEAGYMRGIATGDWVWADVYKGITTAGELLEAAEAVHRQTLEWWPKLTVERLLTVEQDPFFGPPASHFDRIFYMLENEIHHRGQGMVYLRMLGKEPPAFWER